MKNSKIIKALSIIVIIISVLVMIGWFLDIEILKSILPTWVTMKFTTAFSFFLCGIALYLSSIKSSGFGGVEWGISLTVLCILLIMGTLLISSLMGVQSGIEGLFVKEHLGAAYTTVPGRPSFGTMLAFTLVAIAGLVRIMDVRRASKFLIIGSIVTFLGAISLVGYIIGVPFLYYAIATFSTAMAIHTAILFVLLGSALILLSKSK